MSFLRILLILLAFGTLSLAYENLMLINDIKTMDNTIATLYLDVKAEREVFKQCEAGTLEEYRVKKRKELGESMRQFFEEHIKK